jgi:uncharacterized repeat protein (TIGR04138 family)
MENKPTKSIEEIFAENGRYPLDAVQFVREGLNHSVKKFHPEEEPDAPRHISGEQLCKGLLELAWDRWGLMAKSVLNRWNLNTTRDFGEIVFLLVENGWMQKEPNDSIEDFVNVYDFNQAFQGDFEISLDG